MNIKETLSAFHPENHEDDPLMNLAIEEAEKDPELLRWFTEQLEMDNAIRETLHAQKPPEELLGKLLQYQDAAEEKRKLISPFFRSTLQWGAIAACLLITTVFAFKDTIINNQILGYHASLSSIEKHDDFRIAMAEFVDTTIISLDFLSEGHNEIRQWLKEANQLSFATLPDGLEALDTLGCKSFKWQDQSISLICFHSNEGNGRIVHLFIKEVQPTEDAEFLDTQYASLQTLYGRQTKGWVTNGKHYILVGSDPDVDLTDILV